MYVYETCRSTDHLGVQQERLAEVERVPRVIHHQENLHVDGHPQDLNLAVGNLQEVQKLQKFLCLNYKSPLVYTLLQVIRSFFNYINHYEV